MLTWKKHPFLGHMIPSDAEIAQMRPEELMAIHQAYHEAIENSERDPLRYGTDLKPWKDMDKLLGEYNEVICYGGNRCLAGEQEIYDPVKQQYRRVDEIEDDFCVLAWDGKKAVPASARRPFRKPHQDLYRVELSDGTEFRCSPAHKILTQQKYASVGELDGTSLVVAPGFLAASSYSYCLRQFDADRPVSIWDIGPSMSSQDGEHLIEKLPDLKCRCFVYCHLGDGQPLSGQGIVPSNFPSLADAQEYISCVFSDLDGSDSKSLYIRICLQSDRPSILDGLRRLWARCVDTVSRFSCKPCKSASPLCADQAIWTDHLQFAVEFFRQLRSKDESVRRGIRYGYVCSQQHYTIPVKSDYLRTDSVWDFTVPHYHNYIIGNSVHHNSGKTAGGARTIVKAALENHEALILCFAQDITASVRVQQRAVYEWLPQEYKQNVRSATGYIKYSLKNGFTGDSLIIPDTKTQIAFHTYSQFLNNPGKFEGLELGAVDPTYTNIGLWLDEYLQGPDLVNTLRFRLATRDAKMLITFTPIDGITEFLQGYLKGAETLETREAELLGGEQVPYIQKATRRNAAMIYFHSKWNPFGGYERLAKDLKDRPKNEILTRAYGVPVGIITGQFPMFKRSVNVMKHEDIMAIVRDNNRVTRYQGIDPAPNKRWFVIWVAVSEDDSWYVYREWPDKSYGDWAEMGQNNRSRYAEASKPDGKGILDYVELFKDEEHGEKIYERLIDPRMGATPKQVEEGTTTIIDQLEDEGCVVLPAPGAKEEAGITLINGLLSYNEEKPIDALNRPKLYISERCENTIDSLISYTASEGPNEAWKDPIDVLRYLATSELVHEGNLSGATRIREHGGY